MKRLANYLFLFFLLAHVQSLQAQQDSDFEIVQQNIFTQYQQATSAADLNNLANKVQKEIQADGSWKDINYADNSLSSWEPDVHIKRIGLMAKAYSRKDNKFYLSASTHQRILNAIRYWVELKPEPTSKNWWWLSISVPKEIGQLLIAMRTVEPGVPEDLEKKLISWMSKTASITKSPGRDGSNLTDIAQHMIMEAALTKDAALIKRAVDATAATIKISPGDGIQRDMSFHAHGPENYMHGYGREYLSGIRNVATYIQGTRFSFTPDQIALISDFTRNGFLQVIRGRYVDFSVIGRGIARNNATRVNVGIVKQIREIDINRHQEEYDQAIARIEGKADPSEGISPKHIYYWRSDYTVHHRPEFMVGLNIASSRSVRTESGNGENLTGHFLTEGATFIAVEGNEYHNIFPNWEWNKIPGTTTPEVSPLKKRRNWVANRGNSDFVGGVSDGLNGISVYQMSDYNTKANKSWFFFDDKVICLGSGISANRQESITTTLNQSWLKGPVLLSQNGDFEEFKSEKADKLKNIKWIYHDQVGYYFPENQSVMLFADNQPGAWSEINSNSSSKIIEKDVFKLWIDHGKNPKEASYAYILLPGVENAQELTNKNISSVVILQNSPEVQAVQDKKNGLLGVVFYKKGKFYWENNRLETSQPVLVQLENTEGKTWKVTLSEPTQKLTGALEIKLQLEGIEKIITFELPEGDMAGSSVSQSIQF
ncbi:polysaccharide lyase 8 family protein [Algoriphagus yeomjeoni]|nr:polysaccharide lyase 8 family protein [Algoriphagus yeomjeoni]